MRQKLCTCDEACNFYTITARNKIRPKNVSSQALFTLDSSLSKPAEVTS